MYPWFRLARVLFDRSKPRRAGVLDTTIIRLRAWPNDLDINLHVNNGRYLSLADLARFDWFRRTGLWSIARKHRVYPVIGDATAKFRREVKAFEKFEIHTRMVGWDAKWGFLEHRFVRKGRTFCVVSIRGVFTGPGGAMTPGDFLAEMGMELQSPPLPDWAVSFKATADKVSEALRAQERGSSPTGT